MKKKLLFVPLVGKTSACRQKGGYQTNKGITLLPCLTAVLPPQGRERVYGFTLIELLVVVLIIGILAAVALPQYQKAVLKSKVSLTKEYIHTLAQAEELYFMANNTYTTEVNELDVHIAETPSRIVNSSGTKTYYFGWGYIEILATPPDKAPRMSCRVNMTNGSVGTKYEMLYNTTSTNPGKLSCTVYGTRNQQGRDLCTQETGKKPQMRLYQAIIHIFIKM